MSTLDPMEERAAATILVEATDPATAAADPRVSAFLHSCSGLLGREAASIMDLRWRHELGSDEVSTRLSIPVEWVDDQVAMLPALFGNMVRARILWFGGQPKHDELAAQLAAAGATSFDATTSRTILAHARSCEICDDNTTMRIEPIVAFRNSLPPEPATPAPQAPTVAPSEPTSPSSAAAARISAATAAGSAAAAAAPRTSVSATPPPIGPRHAPVGTDLYDEGEGNKKKLLIGGIAAAVVILLLAAFLLTRGGGSKNEDDVASGASPTTIENRVYASTSSTASTTTTTRPPTTTTTAKPDALTATINGALVANVTQGFPTSSATLAWFTEVAPVDPQSSGQSGDGASTQTVTRYVEIAGPGAPSGQQEQTGSIAVCPSAETDICNVVPGSYDYTLTLFRNGQNVATATVTLVVDPAAAPPASTP